MCVDAQTGMKPALLLVILASLVLKINNLSINKLNWKQSWIPNMTWLVAERDRDGLPFVFSVPIFSKWPFYPFFLWYNIFFCIIIKQHTLGLLLGIFNYCAKLSVIETKSIVSKPSFFPQVHPVKLKAWKLFSGGVIRLGLNSPAGRPVYDWRRPVPCACHFLTCLTGWGQPPQIGSLDGVFYSWANK